MESDQIHAFLTVLGNRHPRSAKLYLLGSPRPLWILITLEMISNANGRA